jgi:hypothetical protein
MGCVGTTLVFASALLAVEPAAPSAAGPIIWKLDRLDAVGGKTPVVEGAPKIVRDASGAAAAWFNGRSDGVVVPGNPIAGRAQFTIEILFFPEADGLPAQRFLHIEDEIPRRALIETRLNKSGQWWLDTFLFQDEKGLPLIDPKKVHPTDRWYWAALRYDGKRMTSFVNGVKELEGDIAFGPMVGGETSLGVRLNRVYWFKGAIREVRFHPTAIEPAELQRVKE